MKNIILVFTLFITFLSFSQEIKVDNWTYLYSSPFYSWEKQNMPKPTKLLKVEKDSVVNAIGFYLLGDQNRYVGDLKVKVKNQVGWMSSIAFRTNDVRTVPLLNQKEIEKRNNAKTIQMTKNYGGTFTIACKVNDLPLNFVFDTGASDVSISMTEALFMFKNGYLNEKDITGTEYYSIANGEIQEGTTINLRKLEFGDFVLYNVKASISNELKAPLLLGQSALSKLGKITIDYSEGTLTIIE